MEKYGNFELFFEKLQGLKIGWGIMNYAKVSCKRFYINLVSQ
jgi:hypothetical protein